MSTKKRYWPLAAAVMSGMLCLQAPSVRADLVTTDQLVTQSQVDQDRARIQAFLDRADVKQKLRALGVPGPVAKDRVGAMSEGEAHLLAQKIDALPAGGSLSSTDLILILLIAILVAIAI
jgi:Family of unknown function (DUF6627)